MADPLRRPAKPASEMALPLASLLCVNGLNYLFFLIFARNLSSQSFLDYCAATAIFMFALAISEGGIIYSAPPFLKNFTGVRAARIASAFLFLSFITLGVVTLLGTAASFLLGQSGIDFEWLQRCCLLAAPNLFLQNWVLIRIYRPVLFLILISSVRAAPILVVQSMHMLDLMLYASFGLTVVSFLVAARRTRSLKFPKLIDICLCAHLIRGFFVVRLFSTIVTSSAPLLLNIIATREAAAAYLIGDRARALVSAVFQPAVQALYLLNCRKVPNWTPDRFRVVSGGLVCFLLLSSIVLALASGTINDILFASHHPDPTSLAMFIIAGHISVASALGYFLVLIPGGHTSAFVRSSIAQAALFLILIVTLTTAAPIRNPALSALAAESFLLLAIGTGIAYTRRTTPHGSIGARVPDLPKGTEKANDGI